MTGKRTRPARDGPPPTVSVSLSGRAQTTQDFAVGIGVFILAVAFVFTFTPSLLMPYESSVGGSETAAADRLSDQALAELATEEGPNTIDAAALENGSLAERDRLDLEAERYQVNIRLEVLDGGAIGSDWSVGAEYDDQSSASSARIVTLADGATGPSECDTACRLIVRVW